MRTAAQVMTVDPIVVGPDDTFEHCAETMRLLDIRHLVVVTATGKLAGMVSDTAVFEHGRFAPDGAWVPARPDLEQASIAKVVRPAEALDPSVPVVDALRRLLTIDEDVLVFVDRAQMPVGVLTEHDALTLASREVPTRVLVGDVMATSIVTVEPETMLAEASEELEENGIRHLPVRDHGRLVGVVSARDLLWASGTVVAGGTVGQLVDTDRPLITTTSGATLRQAAERMADCKIGCLPVLASDGSLEGLVTVTDALKALLSAMA